MNVMVYFQPSLITTFDTLGPVVRKPINANPRLKSRFSSSLVTMGLMANFKLKVKKKSKSKHGPKIFWKNLC